MKQFVALLLLCELSAFTPRKITWTAIGDSITYLNDHHNDKYDRMTSGYMTRVSARLPEIRYINQGHNGWTTADISKEIEHLGLTKTDIYSVFLGTNDWWSGLSLGTINDYINNNGIGTTYGAYRVIINKIRDLNPRARIILITPMQRGDFVSTFDNFNTAYGSYRTKNGQELAQFADAVKEIGSLEHFQVVDVYYKSGIGQENVVKFKRLKDTVTGDYRNLNTRIIKAFHTIPGKDEYPYPLDAIDYTFDGLHPSDRGFHVIADMIVHAIKKSESN